MKIKNLITMMLLCMSGAVSYAVSDVAYLEIPEIKLAIQLCDVREEDVPYSAAEELAKDSRAGSYGDWRLPTAEEMEKIERYMDRIEEATMNYYGSASLRKPGYRFHGYYWTSSDAGEAEDASAIRYNNYTPYANSNQMAIAHGYRSAHKLFDKNTGRYSYEGGALLRGRLVRTLGPDRSRETNDPVDTAAGYIVIPELNLAVQTRNAKGYDLTLEEAKSIAGQSRIGGYSDWRIPTQEEMVAIAEHLEKINNASIEQYGERVFDERGFDLYTGNYWTSSNEFYDEIKNTNTNSHEIGQFYGWVIDTVRYGSDGKPLTQHFISQLKRPNGEVNTYRNELRLVRTIR